MLGDPSRGSESLCKLASGREFAVRVLLSRAFVPVARTTDKMHSFVLTPTRGILLNTTMALSIQPQAARIRGGSVRSGGLTTPFISFFSPLLSLPSEKFSLRSVRGGRARRRASEAVGPRRRRVGRTSRSTSSFFSRRRRRRRRRIMPTTTPPTTSAGPRCRRRDARTTGQLLCAVVSALGADALACATHARAAGWSST